MRFYIIILQIISSTPLLDLSSIYGNFLKNLQEKGRLFQGGLLKYEVEEGRVWPPSTKTQANLCLLNQKPYETRCHNMRKFFNVSFVKVLSTGIERVRHVPAQTPTYTIYLHLGVSCWGSANKQFMNSFHNSLQVNKINKRPLHGSDAHSHWLAGAACNYRHVQT